MVEGKEAVGPSFFLVGELPFVVGNDNNLQNGEGCKERGRRILESVMFEVQKKYLSMGLKEINEFSIPICFLPWKWNEHVESLSVRLLEETPHLLG